MFLLHHWRFPVLICSNSTGVVIDVSGNCCNNTLAADGRCCPLGQAVDDCGVCGGANECALNFQVALAIGNDTVRQLVLDSPISAFTQKYVPRLPIARALHCCMLMTLYGRCHGHRWVLDVRTGLTTLLKDLGANVTMILSSPDADLLMNVSLFGRYIPWTQFALIARAASSVVLTANYSTAIDRILEPFTRSYGANFMSSHICYCCM